MKNWLTESGSEKCRCFQINREMEPKNLGLSGHKWAGRGPEGEAMGELAAGLSSASRRPWEHRFPPPGLM